ncbi:uncharacterized protein PV06_03948 [Exophiala oligosperma]|uniref:Zn(2)-C6 fungal-type domain-containing protein n=1 Tax=Exophiala oligosperma TaxID=215243 RepID=A0A0D2C726_9EURO|nr:uncharacterized protein PV06_03948 [Exophiala oligosperma]KIW45567.1 hypothetical protein PV06_03948 [Exophiala oligosperma]
MASLRAPKRPRLGDRTALACTECKQRKLKCDGQSPTCQHCLKTGRDCLVEDPATGLQRPRDYLQSLESRVALLESLLRETRPDVAIDHFNTVSHSRLGEVPNQGAISEPPPQIDHGSSHQPIDFSANTQAPVSPGISNFHHDDDDGDDLASNVALLALSASGREPHYFGPSSALSFSRIASSALKTHKRHGGSQPSTYSDAVNHVPAQKYQKVVFPTPNIGHTLSAAYFNHVHPQYPFLHRPTLDKWEENCLQAQQAGTVDSVKEIPLFFVLMVYAIGSLIIKNGDRSDDAEAYYAAALNYVDFIMDMDSMESIQAVLACAVYSIRSPVGASIWKLSGMAIRHCIELGYHRSVERFRPNADPLTREMSKRIFWVAYDIDRAAALTLGRPFGISDQMIDVELPLDIDDSGITTTGIPGPVRQDSHAPPTQMTGALHIIKLRQLWSRISDSIYSAVSVQSSDGSSTCAAISAHVPALRQALEEWFADTPYQPQHPDTGPVSVFTSKDWFRLAYDHSIILLYRHCLTCEYHRQPNASSIGPQCSKAQVDAAFQECASSARQICVLYRRTYQRSPIRYTWGSLHILFLAGLTYLHCLWSSETVRKSIPKLDVINTCTSCNMVLVIIAERWSVAASYRDLFEKLSERTINMVFGGPGGNGNNMNAPPSSLTNAGLALESSHDDNLMSQPIFDDLHLEDWLVNLEDINVPDESEWLVQGLIRGFGGQQDDNMTGNLEGPMF